MVQTEERAGRCRSDAGRESDGPGKMRKRPCDGSVGVTGDLGESVV